MGFKYILKVFLLLTSSLCGPVLLIFLKKSLKLSYTALFLADKIQLIVAVDAYCDSNLSKCKDRILWGSQICCTVGCDTEYFNGSSVQMSKINNVRRPKAHCYIMR